MQRVNLLNKGHIDAAKADEHATSVCEHCSRLRSTRSTRLRNPNFRRKCNMAEGERKNWRELCSAALEANDPDELLKILQDLNKALKSEEQVRRDFREATRANNASSE